MRVLANLLNLPGFAFESSTDVLAATQLVAGEIPTQRLGNRTGVTLAASQSVAEPVVAAIYQLDGIVRRSSALQQTADGRSAMPQAEATA